MASAVGMFTNEEKLACAEREVRWRQRVYPGLVQRRRMRQEKMRRELALMAEIAEDYRKLVELNPTQRRMAL